MLVFNFQTGRLSFVAFFFHYFFFFKYAAFTVFKFLSLHFFRIKFVGKGYRLFVLRRNSVIFNFNYAHLVLRYYFASSFIVFNKLSIGIFGLNFFIQSLSAWLTFFVRPRNIFTGRGIRLRSMLVRKKDGKISLYR